MIALLVIGGAVALTGVLSALFGIQSGERHRVAGGAAYLVALVTSVLVFAALSLTVWEDNAQVVDRTTGTVERLLSEEAVVLVSGTQVRILTPRIPYRPQEGDEVLVTIDRAGLYDVEFRDDADEVDARIARNLQRRPPAPRDAVPLLVLPLIAAAITATLVARRWGPGHRVAGRRSAARR